ncbi:MULTISPECIES: WhiB family transcriptional regulator [unclassified Streptomyces]|uniref:WhiB family transcriptional regulator n=1 Tax=unclassified Streptomyces TaxID=2593676 RepID=UPI0003675766|nr:MULTISPECIES: WhiB family transcriptional regulator [unclassified Streptomyces]MYX36745.1 WhiB family transcriptional regulator [Streptomyces sp. SID8377]
MTDQNWREQAACRDHPDPDLWFPKPTDYARQRAAVLICRACPVQADCDQWAEDHRIPDGIWGGRSVEDRRNARRRARRVARYARQQQATNNTPENDAA